MPLSSASNHVNARRAHHRAAAANHGFTLIELLTVIAIIGILAAIIVPTVAKVRSSAHNATCLSNLRQIGVAVILYANDNKQIFPPASDADSNSLSSTLRPYMGAGKTVNNTNSNSEAFICPARGVVPEDSNNFLRSSYSAHLLLFPSIHDSPNAPRYRTNTITRPSEIIMIGDATQQTSGSAYSNLWSVGEMYVEGSAPTAENFIVVNNAQDVDPLDGKSNFRYRHNGHVNVVFIDGHAGSFDKGTIKRRNIAIGY